MRITNYAGIDLSEPGQVYRAAREANSVGHWRRLLAIYGDHVPSCAVRHGLGELCDCGWDEQWEHFDG